MRRLFQKRVNMHIEYNMNIYFISKSNHDEIMAPKSVKVMASILVIRSTEIAMLLTLLAGDVSSNPGPIFNTNTQVNFNFSQSKGIKICHWNVQRLTDSKFEEIKHGLTSNPKASHNLDVLFISETFCSGSTPISVYAIGGYNVYRKDRIGKSGGGL